MASSHRGRTGRHEMSMQVNELSLCVFCHYFQALYAIGKAQWTISTTVYTKIPEVPELFCGWTTRIGSPSVMALSTVQQLRQLQSLPYTT